MQTEPEKLAMEEEKKPYNTPKLIKHGTIEQITGMEEEKKPYQTPILIKHGTIEHITGGCDFGPSGCDLA